MSNRGMVIVGAGETGVRAAFALRELGYRGAVTLLGEEPHIPYERPPLSKAGGEAETVRAIVSNQSYGEAGISFRPGVRVRSIDRSSHELQLEGGENFPYERLLLATGATPRELPGLASQSRVHVLRTIEHAAAIRRHMGEGRHIAVLGGGFIGLELAAMGRMLGAAVTLIEVQPRILMRGVPEALALALQERHEAEGVVLHCGITVDTIDAGDDEVRIRLADGSDIRADALVVGIGAQPNVSLALQAGLVIDNGIAVDHHLATCDSDIFAAGDCCSFPLPIYAGRRVRLESWRNAQEQGALAAANMLGASQIFNAVPWFWSDQYDITLQVAGLADGATCHVRRTLSPQAQILFHLGDGGRLLAASGLGVGNAVARDIRLAEMMIAKAATPAPEALSDPSVKLKSML
ncbi:NAD(P)/FAD-dependent oxidoreductase [Rhizobium herbae]|uniref:3-phenylpropionate/trans-cinnamate dioxygenase ferredoxin reductase subunit n=1 Tax=Rhizobium herbae TaxID=508661 RepID=A0ABS4EI40_9HYPH|nr:FAD-dependent oxidoreductase [Rhizobium herbae]MBP1857602.1 3-phenylpropionate/trans-cinnamate dioxygenase ferredoxin reductase subunit [Rhizobium herbae]